jgi:Fe-S cluster assembly scaffold protein SufB
MDLVKLQQLADYFAEAKLHEHEETINKAISHIKSTEENRDWYRDRVVWGYYGDSIPHYVQGRQGEHEINEPVTAEQIRNVYKALDIYKRERDRFRHAHPEMTGEYFLSGGYGETDGNMLPQFVRIVPAYGCAWEQIYERTDRTISYEGS